MDETLHALGNLLVQAIPTILFFLLLDFFLKRVLFRPLAAILEERRKQTYGTRELAQQAAAAADKRTSEWEAALQAARNQVHTENEQQRARWAEEQGQQITEARTEATAEIAKVRADIVRQIEEAQAQLDQQVGALSDRISDALLRRSAA